MLGFVEIYKEVVAFPGRACGVGEYKILIY